ncbi:hypothetical protein [Gottfriedia luciferensis]|uniref:hypothetical protein n=1 Tax=Gottfriedia luciferensis TaxID=178774 RepID=UPI00142D8435|nr:hypothetical protein [Gottfriedia luciferensis]
MKKEIHELFNDLNLFAEQIANVSLTNLLFDVYEFKINAMQVNLIFTEKGQFDNVQTAFSALFKKELFDSEEWNINDDPSPSDKEWKTTLKNLWINTYYPKEIICIETINKGDFIHRFKNELVAVNAPKTAIREFLNRLKYAETIKVKKGYIYDYFFGQSEDYYFVFEWGIYA